MVEWEEARKERAGEENDKTARGKERTTIQKRDKKEEEEEEEEKEEEAFGTIFLQLIDKRLLRKEDMEYIKRNI